MKLHMPSHSTQNSNKCTKRRELFPEYTQITLLEMHKFEENVMMTHNYSLVNSGPHLRWWLCHITEAHSRLYHPGLCEYTLILPKDTFCRICSVVKCHVTIDKVKNNMRLNVSSPSHQHYTQKILILNPKGQPSKFQNDRGVEDQSVCIQPYY